LVVNLVFFLVDVGKMDAKERGRPMAKQQEPCIQFYIFYMINYAKIAFNLCFYL
jgi:hypothetical protein